MARLPFLTFVTFATFRSALADGSCSGKHPIYVDIHDRAVDGATEEFQYGSFIGVAVPYQNQSLWPSLRRNETSFAAKDFCRNSNLTDCINNTGGTVDFNASTTWREDTNYQSKDSSSIARSSLYGTDDIHLYVHYFDPSPASAVNVTNTPVEYALSGDNSPNIVGLGSASTLMESLVDQELISTNTYSLFIGDGMKRAGPGLYNGSHTFGGYDSARMTGKVHTYNMDFSQPDYLPVTVADIILDDPNNSQIKNRSMLDDGATFEARITTDQYPMLFPAKVTQNFANLLGANSSDSPDGSLSTSESFEGVMKIRLSDGFEVTLPKETVLAPRGLFPLQNNTDEDYDGPFYLSTAWLSQVYLTLDYDAKKFHLTQAILNTTYIIPQVLCPGGTPEPYNYGPKNSEFVKNGMIGAVLGGVIGGLALAFAVIYTFVWWKRQRIVKEHEKSWAAATAWKMRNNDEMEMESLSPGGQVAKFPWNKGKAPVGISRDGDTAYQGRNFSDEDAIS